MASKTPTKNVLQSVTSMVGPHGFIQSKKAWHSETSEIDRVIYFEHSQWSPQLYLNIGLRICSLPAFAGKIATNGINPPWAVCHMTMRTSHCDRQHAENVEAALGFSDHHEWTQDREAVVREHLLMHVVPLLLRCATEASLAREYSAGTFSNAFIHHSARDLLKKRSSV